MKKKIFIGIFLALAMCLQAQNINSEEEIFSDNRFLDWFSAKFSESLNFADMPSENKLSFVGLYYLEQEDDLKAIEYFNKSRIPDSDFMMSMILREGKFGELFRQENYEEVVKILNNIYELILSQDFSPNFIAFVARQYYSLGEIYAKQQDYAKAIEYTQKSIDLDPNNDDADEILDTLEILKILQIGIIPEEREADVETF